MSSSDSDETQLIGQEAQLADNGTVVDFKCRKEDSSSSQSKEDWEVKSGFSGGKNSPRSKLKACHTFEKQLKDTSNKVWCVGDSCLAPFSGDDQYYNAVIRKIFRDFSPYKAKVKFVGYDSDEDETFPLTYLLPPNHEANCTTDNEQRSVCEQPNGISLTKISEEKDKYMKQKYDSSGEESLKIEVTHQIHAKRKRLNFKEPKNEILTSTAPKQTETITREEVETFGNSSLNREEPLGGKSPVLGFADEDLEKPHFEIKPIGEKIPYVMSKKDEIPIIRIPSTINQFLRDYQREGVIFMYKHLRAKQGCLLGDDMGLGKTVQVIALISAVLGKTGTKDDVIPLYLKRKGTKDAGKKEIGPFLIVSPSSVLFNWEDELETWGYFKTARFHKNSKSETIEKAKRGKLEIVLTTYETFRNHIDVINDVDWLCIVMDEAHRVKEPNALVTKAVKKAKCRCRIGLSGTPMQNNMEELWCLLDWANPGCLGSVEAFNEQFAAPIKLGQRFDATKRELATARKKQQEFGLLKDKWILRRGKELLEGQLPRKDERAVFTPLTELQVALYEAILDFPSPKFVASNQDPDFQRLQKDDKEKQKKHIFHTITLLRKVSNHAALLLPYHKASEQQKELALSVCKKLFEKFPELKEVYKSGSFAKMCDYKFSGKLRIVEKLLNALNQLKDKVLLFSTSVQLLNILEAYSISKGYIYRRLDGDTKADSRMGIIREFNRNSDIFLCLVSTKAGGVGLNFTGANIVIIFDPAWNPSYDTQAQDRAYRIGQHRNVKVYRLIAEGSIEENIYLRQVYKQQLSNIAIDTSNERRLFTAVAGCKSKSGELFGLRNLFMLRKPGSNLTNDLLKRSEKIESGLKMVDYEPLKNKNKNIAEKHEEKLDDKGDLGDDGYEDTQCIEDLESDLEDFVENTCNLFSDDEENENEDSGTRNSIEADDSSSERVIEPPLKWKRSRKSRDSNARKLHGCRSRGKFFTNIRKARRRRNHRIESSSEEFSAKSSSEDEIQEKRTSISVSFSRNVTEKESKTSLELMDGVLDDCGVRYTSTTKEILSKSAAEDKMSKEAIKDVFWHGMYSQQPAHFIEPSSSEESDDILCSVKGKTPTAPEDDTISKTKGKYKQISMKNKRLFERIGTDMYLIGETPPLIRKQQFNDISKHFGFTSVTDFALELVGSPENKVSEQLVDFYSQKEPSIVQISSFRSIYGIRTPTRVPVVEDIGKFENSRQSKKKQRYFKDRISGVKRSHFAPRRRETSGVAFNADSEDGKDDILIDKVSRSFKTLKRLKEELTDNRPFEEKKNFPGASVSMSLPLSEEEASSTSKIKEVVKETQLVDIEHKIDSRSKFNTATESSGNQRASADDISHHLENSEYSEDILHEMMFEKINYVEQSGNNSLKKVEFSKDFSPEHNELVLDDIPSKETSEILVTNRPISIETLSQNNSQSLSVLDELMGNKLPEFKDYSEKIPNNIDLDTSVGSEDSYTPIIEYCESQNSVSVLDELMR